MTNVVKGLIGLSALSFLVAVIGSAILAGPVLGAAPEALSRASQNLSLIAIALLLLPRQGA